jgi:hypothetical protein
MTSWTDLPGDRRRLLILFAGGIALAGGTAVALRPPMFWRRLRGTVYAPGGVALDGIDPVAFFEDGHARPGVSTHHLRWQDSEWLFATASHRDRFAAMPAHYAPAYGGFCAFGIARGYRAASDPAAFTIAQNRLYLNASKSIQRLWRGDMPGFVAKADAMWPRLRALA